MRKTFWRWRLTVWGLMTSAAAICRFVCPPANECEHLELACCQARVGRSRRLVGEPVDPLGVGSRAEPGEGPARGVELDVDTVAVANLSAGERDRDPGPRRSYGADSSSQRTQLSWSSAKAGSGPFTQG